MVGVMIVDDENIVRLGLRSLIDWEANGFDIVGTFENGADALEYCCKQCCNYSRLPQIIITDIKMPTMNGITLIKKVKKILPDTKFIILSNYDDFELVSEAFREGAVDYLLKQFIEPENLLNILNGIRDKFVRDGPLNQKERAKAVSSVNLVRKKEEFISYILGRTHLTEDEYLKMSSEAGISFNPSSYVCFKILPYKPNEGYSDIYGPLLDPIIGNIFFVTSEICPKYGDFDMVIGENKSLVVLMSLHECSGLKSEFNSFEVVARDIANTLDMYFGVKCRISCSTIHSGFANVNRAYNQANKALNTSFYNTRDHFYYYGNLNILIELPDALDVKNKEITQALNVYDFKKVSSCVNQFFSLLTDGAIINPNIVKQLIVNKIQEIRESMSVGYNAKVQDFYKGDYQDLLECIWKCDSLEVLKQNMIGFVTQVCTFVENHQVNNSTISCVKAYIQEHCSERLSLDDIATHFYINPNYLSQQFKEKTGICFSNYVRNAKIEKAIQFMKERYLSIEEVAEMVGYDSNYFIKAFKKVTSITISEFRKHCL